MTWNNIGFSNKNMTDCILETQGFVCCTGRADDVGGTICQVDCKLFLNNSSAPSFNPVCLQI